MFSKFYHNFLKSRTPTGSNITFKQRNVYVFPTRFGFAYLFFCLILLLLAINFESSLVYLLVFWLMGLFIVSILVTWSNLVGIRMSCGRAKPIFVGQETAFPIAMEGKNRSSYAIHLWHKESHIMTDVIRGKRSQSHIYLKGKHRGRLTLPRLCVESTYPLGLIRAWSFVRFDQNTFCYPLPIENEEIVRSGSEAESGEWSGEQQNLLKGVDDYDGLVEYEIGDSLRHIYWNAYAKGQGLYVKQFREEERRTLWIDDRYIEGQLEVRLSKMCYLLLQAEEAGVQYGFNLGSIRYEPSHGEAHLSQCLQALALY